MGEVPIYPWDAFELMPHDERARISGLCDHSDCTVRSVTARGRTRTWECVGMHCAYCGGPCGGQGHSSTASCERFVAAFNANNPDAPTALIPQRSSLTGEGSNDQAARVTKKNPTPGEKE